MMLTLRSVKPAGRCFRRLFSTQTSITSSGDSQILEPSIIQPPTPGQVVMEEEPHQLTGAGPIPITSEMRIMDTAEFPVWPAFRLMNLDGSLMPEAASIPLQIEETQVQEVYRVMGRVQSMDDVFYNAQRQGRISFYMQNAGEEATQVGSAAGLKHEDMIFAQYRELGVLLWRGFSLQQAADQCFSNEADLGRGRQMPVHYGSKALNFQTISSPLTTQLPQAVGAAYANKLQKKDACVVCYFGEGAASEGDFHAAMNFASTLKVPILFICRNNGYAISTSIQDQFNGDGIISRAAGYGMYAVRVDGNDLFAVKHVTEAARKIAIEECRPVLIEAMTYRRGHHSTSDDSTRYRSMAEIKHWQETSDPVVRVRQFMESRGWWDTAREQEMRDKERYEVLRALETAEKRPKPPLNELFTDVYREKPGHLLKQEEELLKHMEKYPEHYRESDH